MHWRGVKVLAVMMTESTRHSQKKSAHAERHFRVPLVFVIGEIKPTLYTLGDRVTQRAKRVLLGVAPLNLRALSSVERTRGPSLNACD